MLRNSGWLRAPRSKWMVIDCDKGAFSLIAVLSCLGWAEPSRTHQRYELQLVGFAALYSSYGAASWICRQHKVECPRSAAAFPQHRTRSGDQTDRAIFRSCRYPLFVCRVHDCSKRSRQDVCGLVCGANSRKRSSVFPYRMLSNSRASLSGAALLEFPTVRSYGLHRYYLSPRILVAAS
jgi:hypothetical protein